MTDPLAISLGPLRLRNPILVASGTFGSGEEAQRSLDLHELGGVVTKSVTRERRRGNPPPRIHETASGMLNSIGIMNPGLDGFLEHHLEAFRALPCARIVNVAGESSADFANLTESFGADPGIDGIELNVSCPNVSGGLDFGVDPKLLEPLVAEARRRTSKPLLVKLTPNVTDLAATARAAEAGGADILCLVNTYQGMAVDWRRRRPELGSPTGMGGLSGPAIKPLALAAVHKVRRAVRLPIVGIGGITDAEDVMEFLVAGASAVQVGTANFRGPETPLQIVRQLAELHTREKLGALSDWVGTLQVPRGRG